MKAIILIELDDKHLIKETNDLYDRLKDYKCELKPLPEKFNEADGDDDYIYTNDLTMAAYQNGIINGRNACINEITGEKE